MRKKLIELLVNSPGLITLYGKEEEFSENADWLIAHGVTFATDNSVAYNLSPTEPLTNGQQTNADRIRSMSDEELCEFLSQYVFHKMCDEGCDACTYSGDCDKRLLEWLKQPAEGE